MAIVSIIDRVFRRNYYAVVGGNVIACGLLEVTDPADHHWEDYEEGKRYKVTVIDEDGGQHDLWDGHLFETKEEAEAAARTHQ